MRVLSVFLLKDGGEFYLCVDVTEFLLSRSMEKKNKPSELSLSLDAFLLAEFIWNKKLSV